MLVLTGENILSGKKKKQVRAFGFVKKIKIHVLNYGTIFNLMFRYIKKMS
jgi:hypothetical protein